MDNSKNAKKKKKRKIEKIHLYFQGFYGRVANYNTITHREERCVMGSTWDPRLRASVSALTSKSVYKLQGYYC